MNKKFKKNNGITLIALVITIIVLLILAGVTIATLTGDNGILTRTDEAKTNTDIGEEKEAIGIAYNGAKIATRGETVDETDLNEQFRENGVEATASGEGRILVSFNSGRNYIIKENGDIIEVAGGTVVEGVIIPEGFYVVEGTTVNEGLVISDIKGDDVNNTKGGNQYVWVPCTEEEYKGPESTWRQYGYTDKTWTDSQATEIGTQSIQKYGGFYIARFEAGIPEEATEIYGNADGAVYNRTERNANSIISKYTPVSKKNMPAWNFVSQTNAKTLAEKMVNSNNAQSYLIDSYAWNAVCRVIDKKYGTSKNINSSSAWGNYYNNITTNYEVINALYALHQDNNGWTYASTYSKGTVTGAPKGTGSNRLELTTGSSEDFKAMNIYDLAGNMYEWTTENSGIYRVHRSGSFNDLGSICPLVFIYGSNSADDKNINFGFRAVLYLK